MPTAREQILARIRATAGDHESRSAVDPGTAVGAPAGAGDAPDLLALFASRVIAYGSAVEVVAPEQLPATIAAICEAHSVRRLATPADLPQEWLPDGVDSVTDGPGVTWAELDGVDGVLTGSNCAAAETGTIALDHGPRQGRRALTLLPDLHICVVEAGRVLADVPDLIEALAPGVADGRPVTLVSGPSATSDIELDRVEGVHGPRRLAVVVVRDA